MIIEAGITILTITGYAGFVRNEGYAAVGKPVEQGRFADIGAAYYGNDGFHDWNLIQNAVLADTTLKTGSTGINRSWKYIYTIETGK